MHAASVSKMSVPLQGIYCSVYIIVAIILMCHTPDIINHLIKERTIETVFKSNYSMTFHFFHGTANALTDVLLGILLLGERDDAPGSSRDRETVR